MLEPSETANGPRDRHELNAATSNRGTVSRDLDDPLLLGIRVTARARPRRVPGPEAGELGGVGGLKPPKRGLSLRAGLGRRSAC